MRQCYALFAAAALFVSPLLVESLLGTAAARTGAGHARRAG